MLTESEVVKHGYTVLPKGGWIFINPEIMPRDWDDVCKDFGIDPSARGAYLCIAGVKEESWEDSDDELTEEYAKYCKTTDDPMEYDDWFIGTDYLHKEKK